MVAHATLFSPDVYVYISSESNTVSEDQGVLKICAEMTGCCPVQPEFNIEFEITNRSAGLNSSASIIIATMTYLLYVLPCSTWERLSGGN